MRKLIVFILLTGYPLLFRAQSIPKRDSLLKLLAVAKEDSSKVLLYINLGALYESNEPESARLYYNKAGMLSKKINYLPGWYQYLSNYGNIFLTHGNYDSSFYFFEQALAVARQLKDSLNIGISLFNIGISYRERSDFEKAIDYCLQGRTIIDKKGEKRITMQMNDALQVLYYNRAEYDKSLSFGEQAVAQARELKSNAFLAQCLSNVSMSYVAKKNYTKAVEVLEESLKLNTASGDLRVEAAAVQNIAGIFLKQRNYGAVIKNAEKSLALSRQVNDPEGASISLRGLAVAYLQQGQLGKAKEYAMQALAINKKNNYTRELSSIGLVLSSIAYAAGDAKAGIDYNDESMETLETMIKEVISGQSAELEKKYETEKKETRIKQLEAEKNIQALQLRQKNIFNYSLAAAAMGLLLVGLLAYRNYGHKQKLQQQRIAELETEKKLTATEAVLKGEERERTRLAKDLHDGLGGMLSGIKFSMNTMKVNLIMTPENQQAFERSMDMLDSSIREMRRVAHNMMPENLVKFGLDTALKDFCNDINQSGALKVNYQSIGMEQASIDQTTAVTLYRIVQELVNNIIKHAQARSAIVQLTKTNGQLAVTVEDDGKGFDTGILKMSKGIGWSNIQNRVDFLKGKLDVQSDGTKGTSVNIEITV